MTQMPINETGKIKYEISIQWKNQLFIKSEVDLYVENLLRHDVSVQSDTSSMVLLYKYT